jgi:dihydroorotate dehydrogenase electron transfer subunit
MKHLRALVETNRSLTQDVFLLRLTSPEIAGPVRPGQFVQLTIPGFFLGRPFSVAGSDGSSLEIIYRLVGSGTRVMAGLKAGQELPVLGPLGRGFDPPQEKQAVLLGGGLGTAPLLMLARELNKCTLVMGAQDRSQLWLKELDLPKTVRVAYCTNDGSEGFHGTLVEAAAAWLNHQHWVAACGPKPMLKALQRLLALAGSAGQFALEEHMACGLGVCMGCRCHTLSGPARVCKEGPVFAAQELLL